MPYLHTKHKASSVISFGAEDDGNRVINGFYTDGRVDGHHVEGIDDHVRENDHERE